MESVKVASNFVINKIVNPVVESDNDTIVAYAANVDRNITKEQLEYYKEVLETGLTDEIEEFGTSELVTDYLPVGLLYNALLITDIPINVCPLNMSVSVNRNSVLAKFGMNKPFKEIYNKNDKVLKKELV